MTVAISRGGIVDVVLLVVFLVVAPAAVPARPADAETPPMTREWRRSLRLWRKSLVCRLFGHAQPVRLSEPAFGSMAVLDVCGRCYRPVASEVTRCQYPLPRGG